MNNPEFTTIGFSEHTSWSDAELAAGVGANLAAHLLANALTPSQARAKGRLAASYGRRALVAQANFDAGLAVIASGFRRLA